jgi:hypothetical protein
MNSRIKNICTNDEEDLLIGTREGKIIEIQ